MNLTQIYKALWLSLLTPFMSSCDDMLDVTPQDKLTPETFFRSEAELELYTNKFYAANLPEASIFTDKGDIVIPLELDKAISCQRTITETSSQWSWTALRDINFYLEHSANCSDASARTHYDGIARFFRTMFYFAKVKNFGDVPWCTVALGSDDAALYGPRTPRETVVQNMLEDLDYAISALPSSHDVYRITKWTALALKSRICLFEGTFRKYHGLGDYAKYLELCVEASDEIIKNGGYSIYKKGTLPYRDLFRMIDANPDEMILARQYLGSQNIRHNAQSVVYSAGQAQFGATQRLFKIYLMKDGSRFSDKDGWETMEFKDETKNRDPRMEQTFCTPGFIHNGVKEIPNLRQARLGYQRGKYVYDDPMYNSNGSDVDLPIFRYAEVLLNYAEAKAELGTISQSDIDRTIKLLRDRVGMPTLDMANANAHPDAILESAVYGYPNVDKGPNKGVILEIRRERTVELAFEGFRFDDILRWKEGAAYNQPMLGMYFPGLGEYDLDGDGTMDVFVHDGSGSSNCEVKLHIGENITLTHGTYGNILVHDQIVRNWNETRDYFYFIPSKERVLNPSLTQNPGWNDGLGL